MTESKEEIQGEVVEDARTGEIIPRGSPTELRPGILAQININQVGTLDIDDGALAVLQEPLDPNDVQIRPDGLVYLPWTWYNKRLNRAFGIMKWGQIPQGSPMFTDQGNSVLVVWLNWLVVKGVPVGMSGGETSYQPSNFTMSKGDAIEGAKSNALARNCKYLGMALELWDAAWVANWKKQYAETYEDKAKTRWRKKGVKKSELKPTTEKAYSTKSSQELAGQAQNTEATSTSENQPKPSGEEKNGYTTKELKIAERVVSIKDACKAAGKPSEIPAIMKTINGLDKEKKYTIGQVVKILTGDEK